MEVLAQSLFVISNTCFIYLISNPKQLRGYEIWLVIGGGVFLLPLLFIIPLIGQPLILAYIGFLIFRSYQIIKLKNESKNFFVSIGIIFGLILVNLFYYLYQYCF